MLRSLHMKLVMIMVLLILSLMTVVGAFLINSVVAFYLNDFYTQIGTVVSDRDLYRDLTQETAAELAGEVPGIEMLEQVLGAYAGELGVNGSNRNFYILDEINKSLEKIQIQKTGQPEDEISTSSDMADHYAQKFEELYDMFNVRIGRK